jgi:hypothetical protein
VFPDTASLRETLCVSARRCFVHSCVAAPRAITLTDMKEKNLCVKLALNDFSGPKFGAVGRSASYSGGPGFKSRPRGRCTDRLLVASLAPSGQMPG